MNRIFVLSLALILGVTSLAVPSYAAETDFSDSYLNIFDFAMPNGQDNYVIYHDDSMPAGQINVSFDMPWKAAYRYIDLIVCTNAKTLSVQFLGYQNSDLTVTYIGHSGGYPLYRVYGHTIGYTVTDFSLSFYSSSISWVEFYSCHAWYSEFNIFDTDVYAYVEASGNWSDFNYAAGDVSSYGQVAVGNDSNTFSAGFSFPEWRKFDYIDISLSFDGISNINSIVAKLESGDEDIADGSYVPIDHSFLESGVSYDDGHYELYVRLDLTSLDRTSELPLILRIDGVASWNTSVTAWIHNAEGILVSDSISSDTSWTFFFAGIFKNILDSVTSGFSSLGSWISQQTDSLLLKIADFREMVKTNLYDLWYKMDAFQMQVSSDFSTMTSNLSSWFGRVIDLLEGKDAQDMQQDVQDQIDDFDHMDDVINSVTTPNVDNIDTDISHVVSVDQISAVSGIYGSIFGVPFIADFVTLTVIFGLGSFLVYGKKD